MTYITQLIWKESSVGSRIMVVALVVLGMIAMQSRPVHAQWTTNGDNINNTNTGNVGIGTTSPLHKTQIVGTNASPSLTAASGIVAIDGGVGTNQLTIGSYETSPYGFWLQAKDNGGNGGSGWSYPISLNPLGGNVGIGVAAPGERLTIVGAGNTSGSGGFSVWNSSFSPMLYVRNDGNVGIGMTGPNYKLDVNGTINATGVNINGSPITSSQWTTGGNNINYAPAGNVGLGVTNPGSKLDVAGNINATGTINAVGGVKINGSPVTSSQWTSSGNNINYAPAGNVGLGVTSPGSKLDVAGNINATGTINAVGGVNINGAAITSSQWTTSGTTLTYTNGPVGIGTSNPNSSYKLEVNGNANVTGNLNTTGTITGGTINAKYQDVAEWVESSQSLSAGTVVVLDHTRSNQVIASSQAYDTRVAGVISLQPGIALGESGAGKVLVATTGRVKIKVDATAGPIQIGDLLVTSDKSGVAKKSEPLSLGGVAIHRPGTLIGKALEPLAKGTGEILVLLSLQ